MLANFSNKPLVVPKATVLGVAEEISESLVDRINPKCRSESDPPVKSHRQKKNEALYRKLLQGKLYHLSQDERQTIEPILLKYAHVFHDENTNDYKCTDVMEHQILVGDTPPIRRPQYRNPYALRHEMKAQVENVLDKGIIRASNSMWSAPAILVPKKTTDRKQKYRFCVILELLTRRRNLIHIHRQCSKTLHPPSSGRDNFQFSNVIVESGRFPLKRNIKSALDLRFHRDIMNLTGYRSDFQTAHQISNGLWI